MYIFTGSHLIQRLSIYNNEYYCIIEKVEFLPGIIRVFIDERGDNSLGVLQDPLSSTLGIVGTDCSSQMNNPIDGTFSISDDSRQYFGYLDFAIDNSLLNSEHIIGFQYGCGGYSTAKLFQVNQELIQQFSNKST